jgi:tRNA-dihydrouridine synthase 2
MAISPVRSTSPSEEPVAKRPKLESVVAAGKAPIRPLDYSAGLFLAPMVRVGTLPTRLLSLEYGASLVWGPETVDRAIIGAQRTLDQRSGVVKYVKNGKSVWETHPVEKDRLVYQLGSSDEDLALEAAKTVMGDVSGIDLNCGCPKVGIQCSFTQCVDC